MANFWDQLGAAGMELVDGLSGTTANKNTAAQLELQNKALAELQNENNSSSTIITMVVIVAVLLIGFLIYYLTKKISTWLLQMIYRNLTMLKLRL